MIDKLDKLRNSKGSGGCQYVAAVPPAGPLIEALRGFGYSTASAIADIIDNSIAAGARNVWIHFDWKEKASSVTILDDGRGMEADELTRAMFLGSADPCAQRDCGDLGRFGLGLKTASLSQCRALTVASKKRGGSPSVRRWDLDYIAQQEVNEWRLLTSPRDASRESSWPLNDVTQGTMVFWEALDRVLERLPRDTARARAAFLAIVADVEKHLAMVFHRFIEGVDPKLKIFINDDSRPVRPWNPFLPEHRATWRTPRESIVTTAGDIEMQGFVLPHKDRLSSAEYELAGGVQGWAAHQGFYVYRNSRLLVAGSWLGLGESRSWTKDEPHKLARLSLELPNTVDHQWGIDVRKSIARPPEYLRPRLRDLALRVRESARGVFAHRGSYGRTAAVPGFKPLWRSKELRSGVSYDVCRDHPAVELAASCSRDPEAIENLLKIIEANVPVRKIWLDAAESGEVQEPDIGAQRLEMMRPILQKIATHLIETCGFSEKDAREHVKTCDPFHQVPDYVDRVFDQLLRKSDERA